MFMINMMMYIIGSLINPWFAVAAIVLQIIELILSNIHDKYCYRLINALRFNTFHYTKQWDPIKQDSEIRCHQKIWENYNDVTRH